MIVEEPTEKKTEICSLECLEGSSFSSEDNASFSSEDKSLTSEMCSRNAVGECHDLACPFVHGQICEFCKKPKLHPTNVKQRSQHMQVGKRAAAARSMQWSQREGHGQRGGQDGSSPHACGVATSKSDPQQNISCVQTFHQPKSNNASTIICDKPSACPSQLIDSSQVDNHEAVSTSSAHYDLDSGDFTPDIDQSESSCYEHDKC
ncbi:acidic repeat-containing protein [Biomphalaria glabrata]|nr:acidic repeat-containing protein [Biomphalaria glabrata]